MVKLKFEEVLEILKARHSTTLTGTSEWVDWDAIYSDLLDEGYDPQDASVLLDDYMQENGY